MLKLAFHICQCYNMRIMMKGMNFLLDDRTLHFQTDEVQAVKFADIEQIEDLEKKVNL